MSNTQAGNRTDTDNMTELDSTQQTDCPQPTADTETIPRLPDKKGHLIFWPIVIIGVVADLWTKSAIFKWLLTEPRNEYTVIEGIFKLVRWLNPGAAWGIAEGKTTILVTVSAVAFVVVLGIFLFGKIHQRLMQVALALFTAGILGNFYDRAFNEGLVRDFLDFAWNGHHWPAFNVADSMLCIAVGLLLISNLTVAFSQTHAHEHK